MKYINITECKNKLIFSPSRGEYVRIIRARDNGFIVRTSDQIDKRGYLIKPETLFLSFYDVKKIIMDGGRD